MAAQMSGVLDVSSGVSVAVQPFRIVWLQCVPRNVAEVLLGQVSRPTFGCEVALGGKGMDTMSCSGADGQTSFPTMSLA